ncbi:hypothetical protein BDZ97DRAFT_1825268, partial [Flammula alnicola]
LTPLLIAPLNLVKRFRMVTEMEDRPKIGLGTKIFQLACSQCEYRRPLAGEYETLCKNIHCCHHERLGPLRDSFISLPVRVDHFYEQSPKGRHLCLVLHVLGPSVESFQLSNESGGYLPAHIVKKVMSDVFEVLCELDSKNIGIHGERSHQGSAFRVSWPQACNM